MKTRLRFFKSKKEGIFTTKPFVLDGYPVFLIIDSLMNYLHIINFESKISLQSEYYPNLSLKQLKIKAKDYLKRLGIEFKDEVRKKKLPGCDWDNEETL